MEISKRHRRNSSSIRAAKKEQGATNQPVFAKKCLNTRKRERVCTSSSTRLTTTPEYSLRRMGHNISESVVQSEPRDIVVNITLYYSPQEMKGNVVDSLVSPAPRQRRLSSHHQRETNREVSVDTRQ